MLDEFGRKVSGDILAQAQNSDERSGHILVRGDDGIGLGKLFKSECVQERLRWLEVFESTGTSHNAGAKDAQIGFGRKAGCLLTGHCGP
jgi:hypothetical protein